MGIISKRKRKCASYSTLDGAKLGYEKYILNGNLVIINKDAMTEISII